MNLEGKNIIVTGGARGIGRELVSRLLDKNANVCVFDLDAERLSLLKHDHPEVQCVECDVTNAGDVESEVARIFEFWGQIDVLVNNAGILFSAPLVGIGVNGIKKHSIEDWNRMLSVNLTSVFLMTSNVVEKMLLKRTKGVIINISSVSAGGNAGQSAYSAAKAGVNVLTKTWAKELSPMGIRFVAVAPGFTNTESTHEIMPEDALKTVTGEISLRRLGESKHIAEGIVFAIENSYCNGKVLEIDGGLYV